MLQCFVHSQQGAEWGRGSRQSLCLYKGGSTYIRAAAGSTRRHKLGGSHQSNSFLHLQHTPKVLCAANRSPPPTTPYLPKVTYVQLIHAHIRPVTQRWDRVLTPARGHKGGTVQIDKDTAEEWSGRGGGSDDEHKREHACN